MAKMSDLHSDAQDLVDRAGRGDQAARLRLLGHYRDYLRRLVAKRLDRRLAARIDASDVVQEILVTADRRLDDYFREPAVPFSVWLRQIAADRIVEAHRLHVASQKRSVTREDHGAKVPDQSSPELVSRLLADDTSPSNRLMRKENQQQIREAIAALPAKDQDVLVMRHLEQKSTAEIAAKLGLSEGAVKARLMRGLVRLRAALESRP
jgi:RNA polymerase sigma-70 factor (ECF subfamily)